MEKRKAHKPATGPTGELALEPPEPEVVEVVMVTTSGSILGDLLVDVIEEKTGCAVHLFFPNDARRPAQPTEDQERVWRDIEDLREHGIVKCLLIIADDLNEDQSVTLYKTWTDLFPNVPVAWCDNHPEVEDRSAVHAYMDDWPNFGRVGLGGLQHKPLEHLLKLLNRALDDGEL